MKNQMIKQLKRSWRRLAGWGLGLGLIVIMAFYGGRAILADTKRPVRLVIYAFSTQQEVLAQTILPEFEKRWEAETGRDLLLEAVFGPSGTLAGQINLGAPADVALISNEQHVNWLKVGRQVKPGTQPVVVSRTPMVIVTRPGNPAGLANFEDLAQPELCLLHADPRSSGAGDWAVLAVYGSRLLETGDETEARQHLSRVWKNVCLLTPSARAALTLFELGAGDALITYEQDARLARQRGVPLEIITPARTILAEHIAVIVDANVTPSERPVAQALVVYLAGEAGQQTFEAYHLRPAKLTSERFPPLVEPFTVETLGGWSRVYPDLIEALWKKEIEPRLDLEPAVRLLEKGREA